MTTTTALSTIKPPELLEEISQFLTPKEQCQFVGTCKRIRNIVEAYLKRNCLQKYPQFFALVNEKQWRIPSWIQTAACFRHTRVAVSEQPCTILYHCDNGQRRASLTHETRDWLIKHVWAAQESPKAIAAIEVAHPRVLLEITSKGVTAYIFEEMMEFHERLGALHARMGLCYRDWKPHKVAMTP